MSDQGKSPDRSSPEPLGVAEDDGRPSPTYPGWVRLLAMAYVLSRLIGPAGFWLLNVTACVLLARRGKVDGQLAALWAAGLACPAACAAFRWWFVRWGRRRWPDAEPAPDRGSGPDE